MMKVPPVLILTIPLCTLTLFSASSGIYTFANGNHIYATEAGRHFNRGLDFQDKGNHLSAISEFEMAIKLRPNFPHAYLDLGYSYLKLDKLENAIQAYTKAVYYDPNYEAAYFSMGLAYKKKGDHSKAIENFEKALSLNPDNDYARHNLWIIYFNLKQYGNAEKIYQDVLEKKPWDWYARLKVAQTYWLEGRRRDAVKEGIKIFRYLDFRK